jgi:integrase/recombinase XerD
LQHQFFSETPLGRKLPILEMVRPAKRRKVPVVLSAQEVDDLPDWIWNLLHRVGLTLIHAHGLRLSAAARLRVEDIDSDHMLIAARNGRGGEDRNVPLPVPTPGG